jgi:hypothetical protein
MDPVYLFCAGTAIVVPIGVATLWGRMHLDRVWTSIGVSLAALLAVCFLVMLMFKVRVGRRSIRGTDMFGAPLNIAWESITAVTLFKAPGMPFYLVRSDAAWRKLWVPGFLADEAGFAAAVEECAGPQNPLSEFLRERVAH